MHSRAVLALVMAISLLGCSGGILPVPTLAPTPQGQVGPTPVPVEESLASGMASRPTAAPTAVGGPAPGAADAPEIAGGLIAEAERDRYIQLVGEVAARDPAAAEWLAGTGLLLRDGQLDSQELALLELLVNGKSDPLWCVTHVRTLAGISEQDLAYFQQTVANPSVNWYFDDDIKGLADFDLLSKDGERSLGRIFAKARQDIEVRKGLYLINALGLPDSRGFKRPVPGYNVQLYLLTRLLEKGIPGAYERAAVAAALTYGSLLTLCDGPARQAVEDYAYERVRLLIDTDVLLAAAGADWRAVNYNLEALVIVLWGGQGSTYPQPEQPVEQAPSLWSIAIQRTLTVEDLQWLLPRIEDLRAIQDEMMDVVVEHGGDPAAACELIEQWWATHRREEADLGGPVLGQQWARYLAGQGFAGGSQSAYVLCGLAASINLPVAWAQLWYAHDGKLQIVPFGFWIAPNQGTLEMNQSAQRATAALPGATRAVLVWWRVPWDNWRHPGVVRSVQTLPLPLTVWRHGLPAGYLLREGVMTEEEILAALGVSP